MTPQVVRIKVSAQEALVFERLPNGSAGMISAMELEPPDDGGVPSYNAAIYGMEAVLLALFSAGLLVESPALNIAVATAVQNLVESYT